MNLAICANRSLAEIMCVYGPALGPWDAPCPDIVPRGKLHVRTLDRTMVDGVTGRVRYFPIEVVIHARDAGEALRLQEHAVRANLNLLSSENEDHEIDSLWRAPVYAERSTGQNGERACLSGGRTEPAPPLDKEANSRDAHPAGALRDLVPDAFGDMDTEPHGVEPYRDGRSVPDLA